MGVRIPALLALTLTLLVPELAWSFRMVPFSIEFDPSGRESNQVFKLDNDSDEPVAVEIEVFRREMSLEGNDVLTSADEEFIVFPSQLAIPPGEVRVVRVQWIGSASPPKELAYRIIAEQLPITLRPDKKRGASVQILIRYVGSIYVRPVGVRDDVVLDGVVTETKEDGSQHLAITLHNRGTAHAILRKLKLSLRSGADDDEHTASVELGSEGLEGMSGENILAGQKRRFVLPWPAGIPYGPVEVDFSFERPGPRRG